MGYNQMTQSQKTHPYLDEEDKTWYYATEEQMLNSKEFYIAQCMANEDPTVIGFSWGYTDKGWCFELDWTDGAGED